MFSFIETKLFSRLIVEYLDDAQYAELQRALIANPEERGGIRVIYYAKLRQGQIWMLTLYAKNVVDNIPIQALRRIKEEIDD